MNAIEIENRIKSNVPAELLAALSRWEGKYTGPIRHIFHCICLDDDWWIGVAGDGDNAAYEYFSFRAGSLIITDCAYGDTVVALRECLQRWVN